MRVRDIMAFTDRRHIPARTREYDPKDERVVSIGVSLDGPTLARLDKLCEKHGVTRSNFVRAALRRYYHVLDRRRKEGRA